MARIPEEDIERLKQEVSVQRLVEAQGIILKRHGADLLGLCPFHDDHEPSLAVNGNGWSTNGGGVCASSVTAGTSWGYNTATNQLNVMGATFDEAGNETAVGVDRKS